jgi:hypothetical protein
MLFQLGDIYNHADVLKQANDAVALLESQGYSFDSLLEEKSVVL